MKTLIQYETEQCNKAAWNYGITKKEYWMYYPRGSKTTEWGNYVLELVRSGTKLTTREMDYLFSHAPHFFRHICKFYPCSVPVGYINPNVRKQDRYLTKKR